MESELKPGGRAVGCSALLGDPVAWALREGKNVHALCDTKRECDAACAEMEEAHGAVSPWNSLPLYDVTGIADDLRIAEAVKAELARWQASGRPGFNLPMVPREVWSAWPDTSQLHVELVTYDSAIEAIRAAKRGGLQPFMAAKRLLVSWPNAEAQPRSCRELNLDEPTEAGRQERRPGAPGYAGPKP